MVAHEEDSPVPRSHPFYAGGAPPLPESTNTPPLPPSYNYDDPPPPMPPFEHFSPPVPFDAPLPPQPSSEQQKQLEGEEERGRKRKSKWGDPSKRILIGGIHAPLPASMNATQLLLYLVQSRLEEIDRKLRSGDVIPPERDRSPSPPPTYDGQGKRTNTRDLRYKKKLEDERGRIIQVITKYNPNYKAAAELKRVAGAGGQPAFSEKVWIPAQEFPTVNFIGLLIGPRGNELKKMERESGAKISIRGKGSLKEGRKDAASLQGADEELHAYVSADTEDKISLAVSIINKIIEEAVSMPETENPLKKQQLKELALLNGTLREDQNEICTNCGATGHRKYDCTESRNFTASLICRICGGGGHLAKDCFHRNDANFVESSKAKDQQIATEYQSFMKSLSINSNDGQSISASQSLLDPAIPRLGQVNASSYAVGDSSAAQGTSTNTGDSYAASGAIMSQQDYYNYLITYYGYDPATAASTAAYYAQYTQQTATEANQQPFP